MLLFLAKNELKMTVDNKMIQFNDHVRYKDMSYQRMWLIAGICYGYEVNDLDTSSIVLTK